MWVRVCSRNFVRLGDYDMWVLTKIRNVSRAILQQRGGAGAKRKLWNREFATGHWASLENTPEDYVYGVIARHCKGGRILDLGCGSGNTGTELSDQAYGAYVGVDVSDVAIEMAARRSREKGRASKNSYAQSDIENFEPNGRFDVILFRESIFYVPKSRIRSMLIRYAGSLELGGVFIVRMCDRVKYRPITEVIESEFEVVEKIEPQAAPSITIVFRKK